jgi:integrase
MTSTKAMTTERVKALTEPGYHRDNGRGAAVGLFLQIKPSTATDRKGVAKSWIYRFVSPTRQIPRWMGLGPANLYGLSEAREAAREARKLVKAGLDPIDQRDKLIETRKVEAAKHKTFDDVATAYLKAHAHEWTPKHAEAWELSLQKDAKAIANLPVAEINTTHILDVLEPIWHVKPETARRTRGRIERVLAFAQAAEYRSREAGNPARWDGHLEELLGSPSKAKALQRQKTERSEHLKALPWQQLPALMAQIRASKSIAAPALEWTILTAARSGETIHARRVEIDVAAKMWVRPPEHMKGRRQHTVPLSTRCMQILKALPNDSAYLFPGARSAQPLGEGTMRKLLRDELAVDVSTHGFRSSFRDWARSRNYADDLCELALAHIDKDRVQAAYKRDELLAERRPMMEQWARHCAAPAGDVVPIRSVRV